MFVKINIISACVNNPLSLLDIDIGTKHRLIAVKRPLNDNIF